MNWRPSRAFLIDFWVFDHQEFNFRDGKLLLRGENGTGKSVTMQSLLPVILDGNISSKRLDPFGSKDRKMEHYVLFESKMENRTERTSYILLEFEKTNEKRYITLGIGLNGRKGRTKLDVWYFIIHNNDRYGYDFKVTRDRMSPEGDQEMVTLSKAELRKCVTDGVSHFDEKEKADYADRVNRILFGFPTIDAFQNWIELLVQLRTPKLANAKDMNVKAVYEILKKSMPALTDDELKVLIDSIQYIDEIHEDVETSTRVLEQLTKITRSYQHYNQAVLSEKARQYNDACHNETEGQKHYDLMRLRHAELALNKKELDDQIQSLMQEDQALMAEKESYDDHEALSLLEKQQNLKNELIAKEERAKGKGDQYQSELVKRNEEKKAKEGMEIEHKRITKQFQDSLNEMDRRADDCAFFEHDYYARKEIPDFTTWIQQAKAYHGELQQVQEKLRVLNQKQQRLKEMAEKREELMQRQEVVQGRISQLNGELIDKEEHYMQELANWRENVQVLTMGDQEKRVLFKLATQLSEGDSFERIKGIITSLVRKQEQKIVQMQTEVRQMLAYWDKEARLRKQELLRWQTMIDPEPERSLGAEAFRRRLRETGIPHAPLFSLIEWKESVNPSTRQDIESALYATGLLDALIIPSIREVSEDRMLLPADQIDRDGTLLSYVELTTTLAGLDEEWVARCLSSISISSDSDNHTFLLSNKQYRIGALVGHAETISASFIGKAARELLRQEKIQFLQQRVQEADDAITLYSKQIEQVRCAMKQLKSEEEALPVPTEILVILKQRGKQKYKYDHLEEELEILRTQNVKIYDEYVEMKKEISALKLNITEVTEQGCEEAIKILIEYIQLILTIQNQSNEMKSLQQRIKISVERIIDFDNGLLLIRGEQNEIQSEIARVNGQLEAVDILIRDVGANQIRDRRNFIVERLTQIKEERDNALTYRGELKNGLETSEYNMIDAQNALSLLSYRTSRAEAILQCELSLPYHKAPTTDLISFAREWGARVTKDSETALNELSNILVRETVPGYFFDIKLQFENEEGLSAQRKIVECIAGTGRMNPDEAVREITEKLSHLQLSLDKERQRLFEEVILNTLGHTIREKITKTRRWIDNLNHVMKNRKASISFRLEWRGKKAESDESLNTTELVELLMARPELLNDEDYGKISKHFRAQVERAREWAQEESSEISIQDALRKVLDYREWFDFKLECYKGQKWEEVNRKFLNTASGGERALSVYVPLFSALHACYEGANEDAARLVTLDEAFAGVDDKNIADMFALLEEMEISYILTSQALWGDYETVNTLSIAHIIRPQGANYASIAFFYWNGEERFPLLTQEYDELHPKQLIIGT
ncbi:TIGR02680 family protein [Brevibacillus brevis]|uniref:TIGR02680 family protein n=1 Tax=Brevibacillus brevis TaxID=1393 RepID=UPI000D0F0751|nr:TIGR02680 family protein [Brevibacillus brevis]PSJ68698.1 TIGR02680 family protein [Brevibacillus brevis]RED33132.1 uncharacterized protein (TIGR02680 family) [Brevibacillus brevis]GEC93303.1 TIGR02680 family protein [Brevibacillus brevis]VEF90802.1 Uncharacterized protein conserved in bacteria [Brevibacillus brevis]